MTFETSKQAVMGTSSNARALQIVFFLTAQSQPLIQVLSRIARTNEQCCSFELISIFFSSIIKLCFFLTEQHQRPLRTFSRTGRRHAGP